jgi:hypothetical protein
VFISSKFYYFSNSNIYHIYLWYNLISFHLSTFVMSIYDVCKYYIIYSPIINNSFFLFVSHNLLISFPFISFYKELIKFFNFNKSSSSITTHTLGWNLKIKYKIHMKIKVIFLYVLTYSNKFFHFILFS